MDQMWKFEAEDGWHLCLRLEKENHCLRLEAEHDGCLWKLYAQRIYFRTSRADTPCHDCGYIIALSRSLAPGDAEQVALCS